MKRLLTPVLFLALCSTLVVPGVTHAALLSPDTDPRVFVLDASELGSGYRLNSDQSGARPNEAASNREDVQRYQQWGRVSGYNAQFEREPSLLSSLTQTVDGACRPSPCTARRRARSRLLTTPASATARTGRCWARRRSARRRLPSACARRRPRACRRVRPWRRAVVIQFRKGNLVQSVIVSGPQGAPVMDDAMAIAQAAASKVPD